ncbi:MAG TPA: carboxymuconolactone decarboxylase family protein [Candidatus Limnocylindrales bacterium]|nr:carboxymuconolactone decarboxylase family protein [Candidatus Limnocylindrales bacterium]
MSRIPKANRESLSAEQQKIWDHIHAARKGGGGPYSMLMHVPELAARVAATEDYFRLDSALSDADREIVILAAARELGAHYPWARHEVRARQAGVRETVIEAIRAKGSFSGFTPREKLLAEVPLSLMREHGLSDELFARAQRELDRRQLIEAIALVGHYSTIGFIANSFDLEAPEGSRTF